MNFNEIRQMAKTMHINSHRMNKKDLIRAIQRAEQNVDCYGTSRVEECHEDNCLWREDCRSQREQTIH